MNTKDKIVNIILNIYVVICCVTVVKVLIGGRIRNMKTHIRKLIDKWIKEDREHLMEEIKEKFPNRKTLKLEEVEKIILGDGNE